MFCARYFWTSDQKLNQHGKYDVYNYFNDIYYKLQGFFN